MQRFNQEEYETWRRFTRKNLLLSALVNLVFNTCYPYFNFRDLNAVSLFHGNFCYARFILPMAFLLPLLITFDIMKKAMTLAEERGEVLVLPADSSKYKLIFRAAAVNGTVTLTAVVCCMLAVHLSLPENYLFDGRLLSVLMGSLAGILAMYFTFGAIRKVRSLSSQ